MLQPLLPGIKALPQLLPAHIRPCDAATAVITAAGGGFAVAIRPGAAATTCCCVTVFPAAAAAAGGGGAAAAGGGGVEMYPGDCVDDLGGLVEEDDVVVEGEVHVWEVPVILWGSTEGDFA